MWLITAPVNVTVDLWQTSHDCVVGMWPVAGLPSAVVPLWQVAQFDVIPVWLKVAPENVTVFLWHGARLRCVSMCDEDLPCAWEPLWHPAHGPTLSRWS